MHLHGLPKAFSSVVNGLMTTMDSPDSSFAILFLLVTMSNLSDSLHLFVTMIDVSDSSFFFPISMDLQLCAPESS